MMMRQSDLLSGSSDMLVLRVLRRARMHRWGIARSLQHLSRDVVQLDGMSLEASLRRMEEQGWVDVEVTPAASSHPVPVYRLTRLGHRQFKRVEAEYTRITQAIAQVMKRA
jgi:DNA-binding PadR family transcriptional regulator